MYFRYIYNLYEFQSLDIRFMKKIMHNVNLKHTLQYFLDLSTSSVFHGNIAYSVFSVYVLRLTALSQTHWIVRSVCKQLFGLFCRFPVKNFRQTRINSNKNVRFKKALIDSYEMYDWNYYISVVIFPNFPRGTFLAIFALPFNWGRGLSVVLINIFTNCANNTACVRLFFM